MVLPAGNRVPGSPCPELRLACPPGLSQGPSFLALAGGKTSSEDQARYPNISCRRGGLSLELPPWPRPSWAVDTPTSMNRTLKFPSPLLAWGWADRATGGLPALSSGWNVLEGSCSHLAVDRLALLSDEHKLKGTLEAKTGTRVSRLLPSHPGPRNRHSRLEQF